MKHLYSAFIIVALFCTAACTSTSKSSVETAKDKNNDQQSINDAAKDTNKKEATAAEILAKREVPVLCYHQIREWRATDSKRAHDDIMSPARFEEHIKMLADSGYHTILPDELYNYLKHDGSVPEKPIMITFDDNNLDHYNVAAPILKKYGFRGVFFIMTVTIGRPRYMNKAQIKELSDDGHTIASHTWNHKNFAQFTDEDWEIQIDKPSRILEEITGKKVEYFAYPYGVFKAANLPKLQEHGIKAAFILSTKRDENYPMHTIRRIIDPGTYTAKNLYNSINKSFNKP